MPTDCGDVRRSAMPCQAFGSNTFNICICLGFIWLLQVLLPLPLPLQVLLPPLAIWVLMPLPSLPPSR